MAPNKPSWWVQPGRCAECGEVIALDEPVITLGREIVERVAGKEIRVPDPNGRLIHARHWQGGYAGWKFEKRWASLQELEEYLGP